MTAPTAPRADRRPTPRTHHGDTFLDPYEWLRDKQDAEVLAYLEAENAYTAATTSHLAGRVEEFFAEIKARTKETDLSVPVFMTQTDGGAWWYYSRTVEGQDYAIHCRVAATDRAARPDPAAAIEGEQVLLDGNAEAAGHEFFALGAFEVSPSGRLLGYLVDHAGDERFTLHVRDLATGTELPDHLEDLSYGLTWCDDDWLFYSRVDAAWRPYQVWRHLLGTGAADDALVLEEADERFWLGVDGTRDRTQLIFMTGSKLTTECRILATSDPEGTPRIVAPRAEGVDYAIEWAGDRLLVLHNATCPDYELAEAPAGATSADEWRPVLPGVDGVRLGDVDAYRGFVVVGLRRNGLSGVHVLRRGPAGDLGAGRDLAFDEPVYDVYPAGEPEWDTPTVRLSYTSLLTPASVLELDLGTLGTELLKESPVLDDPTRGAYDRTAFVQRREWATAADGTLVPVSIVHRADLALDGANPTLLYGYGSYETCTPTAFSIPRLALLERGFVFAIAHVRGGGEMGRAWYDHGKLLEKRNTFTDFVDVARHLIERGYTTPEHLAAEGRSAGGLLMGAVCNLAPETFRAVHAGVPFVDALTSMCMPELPLTVMEWEEWGDPVDNPEHYAYMKSYTPYENLRPVPYPAILATTSLNDTRVLYVEPAKWIAALRHEVPQPADRPIQLKIEMVAGHGGVSGRYAKWRQTAFELAWLCDQLGVTG